MSTSFLALLPAIEATPVHLPMPPWAYGVIALVVFMALLLVTWFFRRTAQTMIEGSHGPGHGGHGGHGHGGQGGTAGDTTQGRHH